MNNARRALRRALAAGALIALAGCFASPKPEYITLSAAEPDAAAITPAGAPVALGNITLPASLDQPYLVRRAGPNALDISDTTRWAAPLAELTHDALARDLAARLSAAGFVHQDTFGAGDNVRTFAVTVDTFSAGADDRVVLAARWQLTGAESQKTQTGTARIVKTAESGRADAIAAAMSSALDALAARMVSGLDSDLDSG